MTKKCSNCGEIISDELLFCPKCGSHVKVMDLKKSYSTKRIAIVGICIIILIISSVFILNYISRTDTTLTMTSDSRLDSSNMYSVQLKDKNNNVLPNQFITVEFNNNTYTLITDSNGTASINLTVHEGSFEVKSYFKGSDIYKDAHTSDIIVK